MTKKISIIIPTYNAEKTIDKCLDSLINQTLSDIEIICVDDCSTDGTYEKLQRLATSDERIKLKRNESNSGTLITRKHGVELAQGEYIMFADNDDWYELNACEELYSLAKERDVDILMYDVRCVSYDENGKLVETRKKKLKTSAEDYCGDNCLNIENRMNLLWNKIVKADVCKQAYKNTKDIYLTIAEDTYACWMIHFFARSFSTVQKAYYNWNGTSGVSTDSNISIETFNKECKCIYDYLNAMKEFLSAHEEAEKNLILFEEKSDGCEFCTYKWSSALADEDAYEGLKLLNEYFSPEEVARRIHNRDERLRSTISDLRKSNTELKEQNKEYKKNTFVRIERKLRGL